MEGIRTPAKAECLNLLHSMRKRVRVRAHGGCAGKQQQLHTPARRQASIELTG